MQKFSVYDWPWAAALLTVQVNGDKSTFFFFFLFKAPDVGKPNGLMTLERRFLLSDQAAPAHRSRNQNYHPFYTGIPCKTEEKQLISNQNSN